VFEFISFGETEISGKYARFLKSSTLRNSIIKALSAYDVDTFKKLSIFLSKGYINKNEIFNTFITTMTDEYAKQNNGTKINPKTVDVFSSELLLALEEISNIWMND
jgi:hypothetical protein